MTDEVEQAEAIARKLSTADGRFVYLTPSDRGVLMVAMNHYRELARRLSDVERKVNGTGGTVLDREGA